MVRFHPRPPLLKPQFTVTCGASSDSLLRAGGCSVGGLVATGLQRASSTRFIDSRRWCPVLGHDASGEDREIPRKAVRRQRLAARVEETAQHQRRNWMSLRSRRMDATGRRRRWYRYLRRTPSIATAARPAMETADTALMTSLNPNGSS